MFIGESALQKYILQEGGAMRDKTLPEDILEDILHVRGLWKSFRAGFAGAGGRKEVLKGLDFRIPKGSWTAFLGANGSGKTTAFKCLLRLIRKDRGRIVFFGGAEDFSDSVRRQTGFAPERLHFFEELSLEELLFFYARLSAAAADDLSRLKKRALALTEKANLSKSLKRPLRSFSKGMLQKTSLIQCFLHQPRIALLDEPFSGLDPEGLSFAEYLFEEMRRRGGSVFFSSHILSDIERLCDRLVILKDGKAVFEGPVEKLPGRSKRTHRIVFLEKGERKTVQGLDRPQCQSAIQRLLNEKSEVLSVQPEYQSLKEAYIQIFQSKKASDPPK